MSPVENKKSWKDIHSGFNSIQINISLIKQMYHSPINRLYNLNYNIIILFVEWHFFKPKLHSSAECPSYWFQKNTNHHFIYKLLRLWFDKGEKAAFFIKVGSLFGYCEVQSLKMSACIFLLAPFLLACYIQFSSTPLPSTQFVLWSAFHAQFLPSN